MTPADACEEIRRTAAKSGGAEDPQAFIAVRFGTVVAILKATE